FQVSSFKFQVSSFKFQGSRFKVGGWSRGVGKKAKAANAISVILLPRPRGKGLTRNALGD
ncbi:MAG: hypothetical protein WD872_00605, partial [Pirellulaceae bacterium]